MLAIEKSILPMNLLAHRSNNFLLASTLLIYAGLLKHESIYDYTSSSTLSIYERICLHSDLMQLNW